MNIGIDAALFAVSWMLALQFISGNATPGDRLRLAAAASSGSVLVAWRRWTELQAGYARSRVDESFGTTISALSGVAASAVTAAAVGARSGWISVVPAAILATTLMLAGRAALRTRSGLRCSAISGLERVAIIGTGAEAANLFELLHDHPEMHVAVVGVLGDRSVAERNGLGSSWLGPADELDLLESHGVDWVVVTSTGFRGPQFSQILDRLLAAGYPVRISTGVTRLAARRFKVEGFTHEPFIRVAPRRPSALALAVKRWLDVAGAALLLVVLSPLMAATALAVKLEDRGPVLFRQRRVGLRGQPFDMLKFRSMVIDADARKHELHDQNERRGPLFKINADPRITRVGRIIRRTSIDELPQLISVLQGQMSLVGPRPALPEEQDQFDAGLQHRVSVRPGLTGLWQVEARTNASFSAYRRLDLHYVDNWNLMLDLRILIATVELVLCSLVSLVVRPPRGSSVRDVPIEMDAVPAIAPGVDALLDIDSTPMRSPGGSEARRLDPVRTASAVGVQDADL